MDSLAQHLAQSSIEISSAHLELMERHARMVIAGNESLNLTRIVEWPAVLRLHILDSLLALQEVDLAPAGSMLDFGSGAGYPGIPLGIATGRPTCLVESVKKKAAFLASVCDELSLQNITVEALRVEEVADLSEYSKSQAVVLARAVSQLPSLVELARPLLLKGGVLVALKANVTDEELRRGSLVASRLGMAESSVRRLVLPGGSEQRALVSYVCREPSGVRLPRRVGLAQNSPLA